ncbi:MAG: hypothetical protein IJ740_07060 [Ruminococcus sp.]|nr:hypothetical protein [Ruminococcus sp.]
MKSKAFLVLSAAIVMCLTGCGDDSSSSKETDRKAAAASAESESGKAESESTNDKAAKEFLKALGLDVDESDNGSSRDDEGQTDESFDEQESTNNSIAESGNEIGINGAAAVYKARVIADGQDIKDKVSFEDLYGRHVLHTGVVGLVGAPVEITFDREIQGSIKNATLEFDVLKSELHGIRPDALMFLWYDEGNDNYVEQEDTELEEIDDSAIRLSLTISEPGVYLLVNKYTWLNVWGAKLDDNGYEEDFVPGLDDIAPSGDWVKNEDTGDILDMIDTQYIMDSLSDSGSAAFSVSTPEQLASACYYVNCCNLDRGNPPFISITLENDIDLKGYKWSPMGWDMAGKDNRFRGELDGGGHTISNITVESGHNTGFIGEACYCYVHDLTLENVDITGSNEVGALVGSDVRSTFMNVTVSGKTSGSSAGTMLGREAGAKYYNCNADVSVNDGSEASDYLSYSRYMQKTLGDEYGYPEKIELKGHKVVRKEGIEANYTNLQWYFMIDGDSYIEGKSDVEFDVDEALAAIAVNGTIPDGKYTVALYAFTDQYYIRVSNEIELDINEFNK